ncbi:MAG: FadR family transcriptional regulator [Alphaproteobacteria bacterium]|nr:FadR family transcriptional regulator [Alphaproteobacteria bacterium]
MAQLVRVSMTAQAVDWLRKQVSEGVWPIGMKIPTEAELADRLGVARNTIREAVKALTHTGVLEVRHGSGTFVRSDNEVDAVFARRLLQASKADTADLRRAIELEATRLACARRTDEDLAMLRTALQERADVHAKGSDDDYRDADYRFHRAVVQAAHNELLTELFSCLAAQVKAPVVDNESRPSREARNKAHYDVVAAIASKDERMAMQAALIHLDVSVKLD